MSNGDPIVVKGGSSIEITFFKGLFQATDPLRPETHICGERKITRVELVNNTTGESEEWPIPSDGNCTIKIHHSE